MTQPTTERMKELEQAIAEMEQAFEKVPKVRNTEDFQWAHAGLAYAAMDELRAKVCHVYELEKALKIELDEAFSRGL